MSHYDSKIKKYLEPYIEAKLVNIFDDAEISENISKIYRFIGSKIDLSNTKNFTSISAELGSFKNQAIIYKIKKIFIENNIGGFAIYIGDNLSHVAIKSDIENILKFLNFLLEIPHHHYIVSEDYSWCMCISMEGDIDFGRL